ncbi:NAD(P)-dependent dehydrogenase, short-chain alcohol dehydrogenase family [Yoonia tamlensis]|uniref:NAD(P)-dependent dehydrogenase, short-chain alcohol dehydrogenase family n=1 Tax=Yoonia tamlensis TaxID=390270 RepID=A0A1I6HIW8_9RHOB|nr:SDR family oxidoreductase [Yoonia tamlensis]SFR54452.1 NAD(P)-dependent dehydrogenase, short-chain alcohol dehydrogenase family [Yoonia tamlensis]
MASRLAIITGSAGDIGRAIAARLMADHDTIILADLDLEAAKRAAAQLGDQCVPLQLDVTDPDSCATLATATRAMGDLKTLVNNAGASRAVSLQSTSVKDWEFDRALNLDGAYFVFQALADQLIAGKGAVVNIASVNGIGAFGHPAYAASKAGMIHLTKMIAVEYGKFGVRANAVAPGTVRTQAWEDRAAANPKVFEEAAEHYALGRIVLPDDVAEAVGFLASPLAAAITGVCLPVDCGLTAGIPALARTFSQSDDY